MRDGFALPAEVRRIRAWWLRYARDHVRAARGGLCGCSGGTCRAWHLGQALQGRTYARGVVEKFLSKRGRQ
jgi:hypothetical protein